MAKYSVLMQRTASTTLEVGAVLASATARRIKVYDIIVGSEAAPATNVYLWQVQRQTTVGTATSVTPVALDPADAASAFVGESNYTVNGTLTASAFVLTIPLNQLATFRWVAAPGGELVGPATANNGFGVLTPTATGLLTISATLHVDEQ